MKFRTARVGHRIIALFVGVWLGSSATTDAEAATWADERTTPHLSDLVAIDRTGEADWLFGPEDVQGDGLATFTPAERAIDLRSAYVALEDERLWLRAYVSSEQAPDARLRVYFFIDTDDDRETGGNAAAPEIDGAFTADVSRGGFDVVIGMQADTAALVVWEWREQDAEYALVPLAPLAATAEAGVDVDPLRVFADSHGYLQASLSAERVDLSPTCDARLLVRASAGDGGADLDVGALESCAGSGRDEDDNGVVDLVEVGTEASCQRDDQCPAEGLCITGRCLYPSYCRTDAECSADERCGANAICRAQGGASCGPGSQCASGLVCSTAATCAACSDDTSCADGQRCAASGRCVDEGSSSGSGGGSREGEVVLAPGEQIQGGAGACAFSPPVKRRSLALAVWLLVVGGVVLFRRRRAVPLSLLALLASPDVYAQVDAERLKPAVTHDGWVNAEGSGVRHPDDPWEFGASSSYAHHPLIIARDGALVEPLVAGRAALDLLGSVSFSERFALGLGLPVFAQHGDAASGVGIGDLRIVPKLELADDREDGVGLALAAEVRAPTHAGDFAGGADSFSFIPKLIVDHRYAGGLRIGANVGVILRENQSFLNVTQGDELAYAAAASYRFGGLAGRTEVGVELNGGVNLADAGDEEVALEALGFLRHAVSPEWQLQGGAGAGLLEGYGVPTFRVFIGATYRPTSHDGDFDGVPDSKDQCLDFAEDRDGVQDGDGCPEEDADGDQDGVSDDDDLCPTEKETINGLEDDDGCPDSGDRRVVLDDGEFVVLDTIRFNTGSAEVHPSAHSLLDQVALTLRAHPEIEHLRIDGHTDDTGPREVNMQLSQLRSLAVKRYLVRRGVSPKRLSLRSYGPDRPRETGKDDQARAKNRRVEFIVE
jgi:OmpA-OmpF porin, OOP family